MRRLYSSPLFAIFICLLFTGCIQSGKDSLLKEWYLNSNNTNYLAANAEHMILRLYPKGIYTKFGLDGYATGKWRMNEKGAYLHLEQQTGNLRHKKEYLKIEQMQPRTMMTGLFFDMPFSLSRQEMQLTFNGVENDSESDPYSPDMHSWRMPPASPETEAAIKSRVKQYLHFLQTMYRHAIDNDLASINDNWYPTPIQMYYANGVRMAYSNELDDWNTCFYDSAQAVKGYQVISGAFYNIQLKKSAGRFERNLDCIEQLLRHIEN